MYHPSCLTVAYCGNSVSGHKSDCCLLKCKYTFGACQDKTAIESSQCREEKLAKNYIKLVLAPQMGQGIVPNTVRESPGISFIEWEPCNAMHNACHVCTDL